MQIKLSTLADDAAGKDGSLVIRRSKSGPIGVPRSTPANPRTARQRKARKNFGISATAFTNLTPEQIAAWNAFGASRTKTNGVTSKRYRQSGFNAFIELTTIFKMASPGTAAPAFPPQEGYTGDDLEFTLSSDSGALIVAGTGATSAGTKIEISTVSLPTRSRKVPKSGYVSRGFFVLNQTNSYLASVPVGPGIHAVIVRYVKTATGQTTLEESLGATTVLQMMEGGASVDLATGEVMEAAKPARAKKAA